MTKRLIPCLYLDDRRVRCEIGDGSGFPDACRTCAGYVPGRNTDEVKRGTLWGRALHIDRAHDLQTTGAP